MSADRLFDFLDTEESQLHRNNERLREMVILLVLMLQERGGPTENFKQEVEASREPTQRRTVQDDRNYIMFEPLCSYQSFEDGEWRVKLIPSNTFTFGPDARWFRYAKADPSLHTPKPELSRAKAAVATLLGV